MGTFSEMEIFSMQGIDDGEKTEFDLVELETELDDDGIDDSILLRNDNVDTSDEFDPLEETSESSQDHSCLAASVPCSFEVKKNNYEESEAKRKAEWESAQKTKREKEQAEWEKILSAGDDELLEFSAKRITLDTERLTRRNMKICVAEHIRQKCTTDLAFVKQTLHPRKNMMHCFRYINRLALAYIKQEMEDNGIKGSPDGIGGDVPDDVCFKWAEEYFYDMDASEDQKEDEKFKPKPHYGSSSSPVKKNQQKPQKKTSPKAEAATPSKQADDDGQITLWGGMAG